MADKEDLVPGATDLLAEATNGRLHWNDPGMKDFEQGWQDFPLGTRVEVRTTVGWLKGTVVETMAENDRGISVDCDEKYHDHMDFYEGRGATVMVYMNTRRGILSNIRVIDEPRREVVIKQKEPYQLEGVALDILEAAKKAVEHSEERLRLAFAEDDEKVVYTATAGNFLKIDGKRIGRDFESYAFIGEVQSDSTAALLRFQKEVLGPLYHFRGLQKSAIEAGKVIRRAVARDETCFGCHAEAGKPHKAGCSVEQCPFCHKQLVTCNCKYEHLQLDPKEVERLDKDQQARWNEIVSQKGQIPYGEEEPQFGG